MKITALFLRPLGYCLPASGLFAYGYLRATDRVAARVIQRLLPVGAELPFGLATLGGDSGKALLCGFGIAIGQGGTLRGGSRRSG